MKSKAHILIVEDEMILYRRMRNTLEDALYTVSKYAPSVPKAIAEINRQRPDIALLDINLQGVLKGTDLGKVLDEKYDIPFIYITDFDDEQTFYEGLATHHEHFMVKTKPHLDTKEIIRAIQTVLKRREGRKAPVIKDNIEGLVDFLENLKEYPDNQATKVPVSCSQISFFSNSPFIKIINDEEVIQELQDNYSRFVLDNKNKKQYYIYKSLAQLSKELPYNFVRINKSYIVNIAPEVLQGRINGTKITISGEILIISDTYKKEFNKRYDFYYNKSKK